MASTAPSNHRPSGHVQITRSLRTGDASNAVGGGFACELSPMITLVTGLT
jgi:hypothetical protein